MGAILESDFISGNMGIFIFPHEEFDEFCPLAYGYWFEDVMSKFWCCEVKKIVFDDELDGTAEIYIMWEDGV